MTISYAFLFFLSVNKRIPIRRHFQIITEEEALKIKEMIDHCISVTPFSGDAFDHLPKGLLTFSVFFQGSVFGLFLRQCSGHKFFTGHDVFCKLCELREEFLVLKDQNSNFKV